MPIPKRKRRAKKSKKGSKGADAVGGVKWWQFDGSNRVDTGNYVPVRKRSDPKSLRNIEMVGRLPCAICGHALCDVHHIKSRGSGGTDELFNIISLCREHHKEVHTIGKRTFYRKYRNRIISHREQYDLPKARFLSNVFPKELYPKK